LVLQAENQRKVARVLHSQNEVPGRGKVRSDALEAQKQGRLPSDKGKWRFKKAAEEWLSARQEDEQLAENTVRTEKERMVPLLARFSGRTLNSFGADDFSWSAARRLPRGPSILRSSCCA
jgi:hypothetical protein